MTPAVGLGMSVVGGAMSMVSGIAGAGAYRSQAAEYQQQARLVALQAQTDEAARLNQLNRAIGTSRAMAAANNVAVYDSGSQQAFEDANRDVVSRNIAYDQAGSIAQQQRLQQAAASDQAAAPWSIIGGMMQGATSIYGGIDKFNQVSIPGAAGAAGGNIPLQQASLPSGQY